MLVRFLKSGPVQAGPVSIHGMPGQFADLDGADLETAVKDGMVEAVSVEPDDAAPAKPRRARK